MKYRMLNAEEREIFDEDFKAFLITNGVHAEEWAKMNQEEPEKATKLVALFSDIVFDKVYQKIEFIEFRAPDSCLVFHCQPDQLSVISILPAVKNDVDLSTPESIHDALVHHSEKLTVFQSTKRYSTLRELEIHQMIEQGCVNSSRAFWDALQQVIAKEAE